MQFLKGSLWCYRLIARNKKTFQINNLVLHLKELEIEEQNQNLVEGRIGRKEIRNIRAEIESSTTTDKINETKSQLFEKINKIDKPLARLIKKNRELSYIRNEREE